MDPQLTKKPTLLTRLLFWAVPCVAVLIAVVTLVPAELWAHPEVDQHYRGFDPNLVYANGGGGGSVNVTSDAVTLASQPNTTPTITLLTTPLRRVAVSFDVRILDNQYALEPLKIGVWSPLNGSGYFVVFGQRPDNTITIQALSEGQPARAISGAKLMRRTFVRAYSLGKTYHIALLMDRQQGVISYQVFGDEGLLGQDSITPRDFGLPFVPVRLSLTASSIGGTGSTTAVLSGYQVSLLHERFWTSKVSDARAQLILLVLGTAALLLFVVAAIRDRVAITDAIRRTRALVGNTKRPKANLLALLMGGAAVLVYLLGNALLFQFAGHPFDMGGARTFSYVASVYGPAQLYYLPNIVSLAPVWAGIPYIEAGDPYGPVSSYLFLAIGWFYRVVFGDSTAHGLQLEAVIKSVNVLFGLADAILIYLILARIGLSRRWALIGSALFLFNPAVWYSMSVWGQTHVISLFFVLLAVLLAEFGLVTWSWLALIASCLTRPQMLVFGLFIGVVLMRKFSWRQNLAGVSWAILVTFLILLPLTIVTSPSLPVDILFNNFHVQEAGGNDATLTTVSQGAYSFWPLITPIGGGSGLQRIYAQSSSILVGSWTYQRTSQVVTAVAMALVLFGLLRRRREHLEAGGYLPLIALGIMVFLMFLTGIVSTHFLLALPFLILCRRWMDPIAYFFVVGIWTVTTLVPMFGDMGAILIRHQNELLAPTYKPITDFMIKAYTSDRFITAGVVANVCALVWLAFLALRPRLVASPNPDRAREGYAV